MTFPSYRFLGVIAKQPKEVSGVSGVYAIVCKSNIYVGQSTDMCKRWREHRSLLKYGKSHSKSLQSSCNEYGLERHDFCVLSTDVDLDKTERFWIDRIANLNLPRAFTKGTRHTEETKAKMRRNHANVSGTNNPMYGVRAIGEQNHMFGRKRPDTSEFNTRTKKGKPRPKRES